MRVLFVYPNILHDRFIQVGIASLAAVLQKAGHTCDLFDVTFLEKQQFEPEYEKKLGEFHPDLLAVSCRSWEWPLVKALISLPKMRNIPVIIGGPHPTVSPQEIAANRKINFIVRGEGEYALLDLVKALEAGDNPEGLPNLIVRRDGKEPQIQETSTRAYISNLDELPYPNWDMFDERHLLRESLYLRERGRKYVRSGLFETTRGCPYSCSYCINSFLHTFYDGQGKHVRQKSPERAIAEIEHFKNRFSLDRVSFVDETFLLNPKRLEAFVNLYKERIGLPFDVGTRPETVSETKLRLIKEAGAEHISIGIESGDQELRRNVLGRNIRQDQIVEAFALARKVGLSTQSYNIIGFPSETKRMIRETVELNNMVRPDMMCCTVLFPFPGTAIFQRYLAGGDLPDTYFAALYNGVFSKPVMETPECSPKEITRLASMIPVFYKLPKHLIPLMFPIAANELLWSLWLLIRRTKLKRLTKQVLQPITGTTRRNIETKREVYGDR